METAQNLLLGKTLSQENAIYINKDVSMTQIQILIALLLHQTQSQIKLCQDVHIIRFTILI